MGKKILDSKALYVVLSILIAVSLWFYVTSTDMTNDSKPIKNIPVTFTGLDILEDRDLMIVSENPTVNITVQAAPIVLAKLTDSSVEVTANVSNINLEGKHTLVCNVNLPAGVSDNQVNILSGVNGNVVTIEVARFLRRDIEIRGEFQGQVADGYLAGDNDSFLFSPNVLTISGQADQVNQVAYAKVVINGEELTDTFNGERPFQLIGANDNVLDNIKVECDTEVVYTTFPIWATAEIPLEVRLISGGGVSADEASCELSIDHITVAGSKAAVAALQAKGAINLGEIDLAAVEDGQELTYSIPLADELTNISGVTEVRATVKLNKKLVTKTVEASSIQPINVPEGWEATVVTQVLPVKVRGSQALIDELIDENILVIADLQSINLAAGQYTVPVSIQLNSVGTSSEIGILSSDYSVVVNLRPSED